MEVMQNDKASPTSNSESALEHQKMESTSGNDTIPTNESEETRPFQHKYSIRRPRALYYLYQGKFTTVSSHHNDDDEKDPEQDLEKVEVQRSMGHP